MRVKVIPVERSELLEALNQGRGDIIALSRTLRVTEERQRPVISALPIRRDIDEVLVTSLFKPSISNVTQLQGKEVWLKQNSSYISSVQKN
ncbi:transporter substrate-binding domain-containing protein [Vibrio chagasii]|nr:transporter substrate-binding domain-containing protein [Vibrio chagasii]